MPRPQPEPRGKSLSENPLLPPESLGGRMDGMTAEELCARKAAIYLGCPKSCPHRQCRMAGECLGAGRDRSRCDSPHWDAAAAVLARHLLAFWSWVVERRTEWMSQYLKASSDRGWDVVERQVLAHSVALAQKTLERHRVMKLSTAELEQMAAELHDDYARRRDNDPPRPAAKNAIRRP